MNFIDNQNTLDQFFPSFFFIAYPFCFEKIMYSQINETHILKTECGETGLYYSKIMDSLI